MTRIALINTSDPQYQQERELRNRVLLRPIGIPDYGWEMNDAKAWHFVAIENNCVIGCVILVPLNNEKSKAQLMQMAVETDFQGKGIGRLLVKELLKFSKQNNIREISCHARSNVLNFYKNLGFEIYDEPFTEAGIAHRHMKLLIK